MEAALELEYHTKRHPQISIRRELILIAVKGKLGSIMNIGANGNGGHQVSSLDLKQFKKQLGIRKTDSIVYFLSGLFGSSDCVYRVVFMQLPNHIWYLKAPFIKMILENEFDGNEVPYWVTSLRETFIRKQPHGPNQLDRTTKNNGELGYPKSIITFTHKVSRTASSLERHSLSYAIAKLHNTFANNSNRLSEVLHSWSNENQPGVIRHFTEKFDQEALLVKFKKDINKTFKARRVINADIALDYFLLDWDIKKFVKNDIGLNHWPKSKLHYIYGRSSEGSEIPEFGRIQKHTIK